LHHPSRQNAASIDRGVDETISLLLLKGDHELSAGCIYDYYIPDMKGPNFALIFCLGGCVVGCDPARNSDGRTPRDCGRIHIGLERAGKRNHARLSSV
jgi:hypothetical protein